MDKVDNIVHYIASQIDKNKFEVFADIPEFRTAAGGTIPPDIIVQALKPDLVILNKKKKEISMFELTVPFEHNISSRHEYKMNNYAHFKTDITNYKANVEAFEIGARGYVSTENRGRLKTIHSFCDKNIKYKIFEDTISSMASSGSYYIYLARKEKDWHTPAYLTN